MLTVRQERPLPCEIDTGGVRIHAMKFSANGEYLVAGTSDGVRVWQVRDNKLVATLEESLQFHCLAVSNDGKWVVVGGQSRNTIVLDARTFKIVSDYREHIHGVDFSPDSTRFVSAEWEGAIVSNLPNCEQVQVLEHSDGTKEAKYSPQGDRIATASCNSVRVWDSNDGHLLTAIDVEHTAWFTSTTGLLWFNDHCLFVHSGSTIKQFDASTGSTTSEWPVPNHTGTCLVLGHVDSVSAPRQ
ncbi:WD40-repeat-containing domain protein [Tylopilus felleus]